MTIYQKAAQAVVAGCTHPGGGACALCVEKGLAAQGAAVREAVTDVARNYSLAHGTRFDLIQAAEVTA